MPYVERVTKAGNTIEIERYFTSRYKKKGISRGDKVKPTKEEQEKVNTRQAERKLRILINANYGYGDYHLVLDYIRRKGEPDRTPEQMRQDIDVFLRECRKEYRKAGLEFKYIHVMEIGKKGARHHHLVVNKIDTEILQRCWYKAYEGHNRVKVFPLDDSGNYAELASYLIKYTGTHKKGTDGALQGKRWNCSKNLVRPEPEYHIISDREYFKKEPKAIKGYYVDKNSVSMGVHSPEYYGYGYLRYTLVKITDRGVEMQIIKGVAIAAVLIIAGLLALIVAAYLAFRIAAAIFEQQESWKDNMIEKIKYWLFQKGKDCKRCCLRCRYYDICRWDVLGNAGLQSEETITLLAIENSKPHKDGLLFRICQYVEFKQKARRENEKL